MTDKWEMKHKSYEFNEMWLLEDINPQELYLSAILKVVFSVLLVFFYI